MAGTSKPKRLRTAFVWGLALLLAAATGFYQRRTGPTWPIRGEIETGGETHRYRLVRSGTSGEDTIVTVPAPTGVGGELNYRRFDTEDEWTVVPLAAGDDDLAAALPTQPPAGKLSYFVRLMGDEVEHRLPEEGTAVIRFKGAVPAWILFPHILLMFLSVLLGFRAAFAALADSRRLPVFALAALAVMTVGGMLLGPMVQKHAFGEYWTGWPNGKDLTDNKMLLLWVVWLVATAVVMGTKRRSSRPGRVAVVAAAFVMVGVYLIPHSLRGSQLNYRKLDEGASEVEAIETG